jgi:hypothetical protein
MAWAFPHRGGRQIKQTTTRGMNTSSPTNRSAGEPLPLHQPGDSDAVPAASGADVQFSRGLQLSRASILALTRLQLALTTGDRHQAMAALDRLHALDSEIERLVDRLPAPGNDDPEWQAMIKHLGDQKLTLAFEKLAFVSGVEGPDLVSPIPVRPLSVPPPATEPTDPWAPDPDGVTDVRFADLTPSYRRLLPLLLALLAAIAAAGAAVVMTALST